MKRSIHIEKIRGLVGEISQEQMTHVESFTGDHVGVYIPSTGFCDYSVSRHHTHPSYSFFYSMDRDVRFVVNGKKSVSTPGKITFIPPGVLHHESMGESFVRFVAVMVDRSFMDAQAAEYRMDEKLGMVRSYPVTDQIRNCVRDFITELSAQRAGYVKLIEPLETRIVHALLRTMVGIKEEGTAISGRLDIDRAIEYINSNFNRQIRIEEISSAAALSSSHFSRLFKRETGTTIQDYIIDVRLNRSRDLLLKSGKNLTEIAHFCGFANSAHFSSSFHKKFGITPSRFRKSI